MNKIAMILSLVLVFALCAVSYAEGAWAGMPNPMVETDREGLMEKFGIDFNIPEEAKDIQYFIIDDTMAEVQYDWNHVKICFRMMPAAEYTDIAGVFGEWTAEDPCIVGDHCEGMCYRFIDSTGTLDQCLWFDAAPGIMYAVNASAADLDGFDVEAIAEQMYVPMQGEADGDSITQGYDLLHVTDIFTPDGEDGVEDDSVVLQGCFGTIDMSKGEADMEYIGFDESETYTLVVRPDAVIEVVTDPENVAKTSVITTADLLEWHANYKKGFGGDFEIEGDFYASFELDEEDAITRLTYVYLP